MQADAINAAHRRGVWMSVFAVKHIGPHEKRVGRTAGRAGAILRRKAVKMGPVMLLRREKTREYAGIAGTVARYSPA